jgi:hypothetical protein
VVDGETFLYRVVAEWADVQGDTVLELVLLVVRVGEEGNPTGETEVAVFRRAPAFPTASSMTS